MTDEDAAPVTVLIVEDEALVRMFLADLLRDEGGFKVVEASNAEEALTILEASGREVRAIVTDVEMPGSLDGFTLARIVRQAWLHIGIVVMSGRAKPSRDELPEGAPFLTKPTQSDDLLQVVRSVISTPPGTSTEAALSVLPTAIKVDGPHTGLGSEGGLAQPLSEPEK